MRRCPLNKIFANITIAEWIRPYWQRLVQSVMVVAAYKSADVTICSAMSRYVIVSPRRLAGGSAVQILSSTLLTHRILPRTKSCPASAAMRGSALSVALKAICSKAWSFAIQNSWAAAGPSGAFDGASA